RSFLFCIDGTNLRGVNGPQLPLQKLIARGILIRCGQQIQEGPYLASFRSLKGFLREAEFWATLMEQHQYLYIQSVVAVDRGEVQSACVKTRNTNPLVLDYVNCPLNR